VYLTAAHVADGDLPIIHKSAGSVSFAVMFIANYPHPKKYRDPGDVSNAAEMLSRHLPPVSTTTLHHQKIMQLCNSIYEIILKSKL
jgi:hypothetical protein